MSGFLTIFKGSEKERSNVSKEVALITTNVKRLKHDKEKMTTALRTLNGNVDLINMTVEKIKNTNFEEPIKFIQNLDLDEDYKKGLVEELNGTKDLALADLKPIKEASEKIRGNMAVSIIKFELMCESLGIQKNVIESGTVNVQQIQKAVELGGLSSDKIKQLVEDAEKINNMVKDGVDSFNRKAKAINNINSGAMDFDVFTVK